MITDLNESINLFRLASRELYNNCFRNSYEDFALVDEGFKEVQSVLFRKLVLQPFGLKDVEYGEINSDIKVCIPGWLAPAQINREYNSGYWDYSIREITQEANMCFASFFDFHTVQYLDHQYVQVCISSWSANPETAGKCALIEHQYVKFSLFEES